MKKKFIIIIRYVLLALAAIIAGVNFQAYMVSKLAGDRLPMPFGVGISVVMSGSMEPELKVGDLLIIKEYKDGQTPQTGDIIAYQSGTAAIVHRVTDIDGDTVTTQGDANNTADEPFDISAVKGKVIFSAAWIGYAVLFLKTFPGIIATLALAVFLLECSFRREKKQKEENLEALKAEIRELLEEQANGSRQV